MKQYLDDTFRDFICQRLSEFTPAAEAEKNLFLHAAYLRGFQDALNIMRLEF